ncbi:C40 family peptidase [Janibacter terrae]|uniref:C40 family peptidase n=1 Tax=Janibacter terrae TaxID=103817 RepID=UPI0038303A89
MSKFYAGRHRAPRTTNPLARHTGAALAVAAIGLGTTTVGASSATAAPSVQSAGATATFTGTLWQGHRGGLVKQVQRVVGVTADGVYGPATKAAVKRWQARHGLTADGIVGARTGTKMRLGSTTRSTRTSTRTRAAATPARSRFTGTLWQGHRGGLVKQVQRVVGVTADGVYGAGTKAAVKRWQARHGLTADGIVGPRTGSAMGIKRTSTPQRTSRTSARTPISSGNVLGTASRLVGTTYRMGGTSPSSGFDCSGFTSYVFRRHGTSLPRTAEQQRQSTTRVSSPKPGDLVFFGSPAWHVGIYAGNGKMYDAGNSRVDTTHRPIWTSAVSYGRA